MDDIFTSEKIDILRKYESIFLKDLSTYRAVHSISTMYTAIELAKLMGENLWEAALAGLLHDSAKELKVEDYPEFWETADLEYITASTITHGPLGAYLLEDKFALKNERIYNAIYYHTTLREDVDNLDVIVYLADKAEPSREYEGVNKIRKLWKKDINKALIKAIKLSIKKLDSKGFTAHPETLKLLAKLKEARNIEDTMKGDESSEAFIERDPAG